ncbi:ATP-dependent protease La [Plesiocystis pacifica SIR-1]|uniref:Lon protease n=1 Tax=Plesiocystis pacifica SIR-1 TaxID=391625 RepID=A6G017_9BACT|nr:endopeptidase La [Plesiocystis pacifica]EDM80714.1 ATP-dependent protease La [Plesiocystis pacifica SIR-1]
MTNPPQIEEIKDLPEVISLLPLRNSVLFPGSIIPIDVGRPKSVKLIEEAIAAERPVIGIVAQRQARTEDPKLEDLHSVGCAVRILKVIKLARDNYSVILQGVMRIRVEELVADEPFLQARVTELPETEPSRVESEAMVANIKETAKKLISLVPELPREAAALLDSVTEPGQVADLVASNLDIEPNEKQEVLEAFDVGVRLRKVLTLLTRQLEILEIRERINTQVQEEMGHSQREYVLRQQLKAIKGELGEIDDENADADEFEQKIAEAKMPEEAEKAAFKQLNRLKQMQPSSAEYTVTRTYLEWLTDLPWSKSTEDQLEIGMVRDVLNEDHYDLEKVKKRILEYMAVLKLNASKKGPILCLAGPPGVGKTSLGKSVARAIGRSFVRISLGGVRDEAEIRGHRRTYVGSLPGRIIQALKRAGTNNPVIVLDEIDKLGHDFRGDPASALLEVLDPEQNHTFSDHYLEVTFDLSRVMFIATANTIDPIPPALRDRLEILELPGYTRQEKAAIAKRFLLPKQISEHGLTRDDLEVDFSEGAVMELIDSYTREAGVRNLQREISSVVRGVAVKFVEGEVSGKVTIEAEQIPEFLGPQKYIPEMADRTASPGVATGLAWTPTGGEIMFIEATSMPGKGGLMLTGQLGDVMKESAQAAMSYLKSHLEDLGIDKDALDGRDIHIHVPAGAIPKDGPSAGVAIFSALVSLLTGRCIRSDVAMTGEITLRGLVLPVGGIKEKLLGAHRAGIRRIFLPERNEKDVVDVPEEIRSEIEIIYAKAVHEVLGRALEDEAEGSKEPKSE